MNKNIATWSVIALVAVLAVGGWLVYSNVIQEPTPTPQPTPQPTPTPTPPADKSNLIRVTTPLPTASISSPLVIKGEARGNWYFEASFPVQLLDANNNIIASGVAQAKADWMTTNFVPFEVTLTFQKPNTATGKLVLHKDNPSGLPQFDDRLEIPIRFN